MDKNGYCLGYDLFPDFDVPPTFQASSTLIDNSTDFTTVTNTLFDIGPNNMSRPTTPSSRPIGRSIYPGGSNGLVTPHGQQFGRSIDYAYASHGMGQQQTPLPAMMYGNQTSNVHSPIPAVPTYDFLTYHGTSRSFSESSGGFAGTSTPTPKQHGMPTPVQSPQSPQSDGQDLPTVPLSELHYNNFGEAETDASGRTRLRVKNDDWMFVETDKKIHVAAIIAAFDVPFKETPNVALNIAEQFRWINFQTEQNEKVTKYVAKNPKSKELSAWLLLEALLDIHKYGYKKGYRISDPSMCCSARFAKVVKSIGNYAVIRFDLVRMQRLDDLATSPTHAVSRKVANWRGNVGKVKRDEANKKEAAAHGVEYKNVLGDKRKYKPLQPEPTEEDDEGNEDTSGFNTPIHTQQSVKRKAGDDEDEDDDFTPSASTTPSKSARKTTSASSNKRAECVTVVAGPDADTI